MQKIPKQIHMDNLKLDTDQSLIKKTQIYL